ncbi:MAG: ABC transporter permease [Sandaracinaceae bacterium]|jgi:lipoprotein-releasing system permease protein|nr:ABC transporter permease [Sandaracinaceae bacterium]
MRSSKETAFYGSADRVTRAVPVHYALQIGMRYLRSKKRSTVSVITFIAITGVALGVAALLSVMSITSGFQDEFRAKVLGVNAHVLVMKYGLDFSEYRDVIARARRMPEVAGAAPFEIDEMMLAHGDRLSNVLVKGVDPELMPTVLDLPQQIVEGSIEGLRRPGASPPHSARDALHESEEEEAELDRFLQELAHGDGGVAAVANASADAGVPSGAMADAPAEVLPTVEVPTPEQVALALQNMERPTLPSDEFEQARFREAEQATAENDDEVLPGVVIGISLARTLSVHVGDRVQAISSLAGFDPALFRQQSAAPRNRDFRVVGIFQAGFQEYDTRLVYADIYEAQALADRGDTVTGVEIRLHDLNLAPQVAATLERDLSGPYHTLDWESLNHNLFTALQIQKIMLSLVIAVIIFVAAFNVIATLIMVVLEKKREIAILKAMGAKDFTILSIFLLQGTVVGVIGTVIGLVLGGGICLYLTKYEFPLDPKVYLIDHLPVRASPTEFLLTILIAVVICVTATLIPSWWAARLLPADGVRYE